MPPIEKTKRLRYRALKKFCESQLDLEVNQNFKELRSLYHIHQYCGQYLSTWNPEKTMETSVLAFLEAAYRKVFPNPYDQ